MDIYDLDPDNLTRHPLSALFGDVGKDDFDEMVEDVTAHGFTNELVVLQHGLVLDGWHRWLVAKKLGKVGALDYVELDDLPNDTTPAGFVVSMNLHRRHLTALQRVDLVVKALALDYAPPGRPEKPGNLAGLPPKPPTVTTGEIADKAQVSERTVRNYKANGRQESETPKTVTIKRSAVISKDISRGPVTIKRQSAPDLSELQAVIGKLREEKTELIYQVENLKSRVQANEQSDTIAKELDTATKSRDRYMSELAEVKSELAELKKESKSQKVKLERRDKKIAELR